MFNDVVTVYNKYVDNRIEKWQRTVLNGVFWNSVKGAVMRKTGVASTDSLQLLIPCNIRTNRTYKPPKAWATLEGKESFWTLQSGDIVIKGDISYEVEKSSSELKQFDDCLTISSVDHKPFGGDMSHWEVSAK